MTNILEAKDQNGLHNLIDDLSSNKSFSSSNKLYK